LSLTGCRSGTAIEPTPGQPRAEHVVVGELQGRTGAFLTLSDAASRVEIVLASLPGQLYRISTPADSGLAPWVSGGAGRVRAGLRRAPGAGPDEVRIVLNRAVRWDIRLPAGAGEQQLNLAGGRISRVDLGEAGLVELRLPSPTGTLPITFTASVGTVVLVAAQRPAPIRLQLDGGAGALDAPWAVRPATAPDASTPGVATPGVVTYGAVTPGAVTSGAVTSGAGTPGAAAVPGAVLITPTWADARDRYSIRARSGVADLTLRGVFDRAPDRPAAR
jgi:hypothetical protein